MSNWLLCCAPNFHIVISQVLFWVPLATPLQIPQLHSSQPLSTLMLSPCPICDQLSFSTILLLPGIRHNLQDAYKSPSQTSLQSYTKNIKHRLVPLTNACLYNLYFFGGTIKQRNAIIPRRLSVYRPCHKSRSSLVSI